MKSVLGYSPRGRKRVDLDLVTKEQQQSTTPEPFSWGEHRTAGMEREEKHGN